MTRRTPLADQVATVEALLDRAKADGDWPTARSLSDTRDVLRWTMANPETIRAVSIALRVQEAFPGSKVVTPGRE